jgi:hypothetical protein
MTADDVLMVLLFRLYGTVPDASARLAGMEAIDVLENKGLDAPEDHRGQRAGGGDRGLAGGPGRTR